MPKILDLSADHGFQTIHKLSRLYEFPDYVKQADVSELDTGSSLPSTVFGDAAKRRFPAGSRASCWLSWLSFLESPKEAMTDGERQRIEQRLTRFATAHAIEQDVGHLKDAHGRLHNIEMDHLPDDMFAIVRRFEDGSKERQYPLRNRTEIKTAAEWLCQYRDELPAADRRTIAEKILEKADADGVGLSGESEETLQKLAGLGTGPAAELAAAISGRVKMLGSSEQFVAARDVSGRLVKLAEIFAAPDSSETADPELRRQVVDLLDQVDCQFRLKHAYETGRLQRPEDAAFPTRFQELEEFRQDLCELPNGAVYRKSDFAKLSAAMIRNVFGDEFAEDVHGGLGVDPDRMADAAAILPRPDVQKLAGILESAGIRPIGATRPSGPTAFDGLRA